MASSRPDGGGGPAPVFGCNPLAVPVEMGGQATRPEGGWPDGAFQRQRDLGRRTGEPPRARARELNEKSELSLEGVRQFHVEIDDESKFDTLCDIYETLTMTQSIIYCKSRRAVEALNETLGAQMFGVTCLHGDMLEEKRARILKEFKEGQKSMPWIDVDRDEDSAVLITTDVLANGIDVGEVSLVINYDIPADSETYLNRVGRLGKQAPKGVAVSFVSSKELPKLRELEVFHHEARPLLVQACEQLSQSVSVPPPTYTHLPRGMIRCNADARASAPHGSMASPPCERLALRRRDSRGRGRGCTTRSSRGRTAPGRA